MTTRYKTEAEKAGVKRRMAALRKRKKEVGLRQYVFWLSEDDAEKVKEFIEGLEKKSE
jgi:coenzyme F420-reducing hydrogenase delta subunit